jgi:hypothetical protein
MNCKLRTFGASSIKQPVHSRQSDIPTGVERRNGLPMFCVIASLRGHKFRS